MLTGRRCGGTRGDVRAIEQNAPFARRLEAGEQAQQRGLAAAGGPEQREEFAVTDVERKPLDRRHRAEALGDALEAHQRRLLPHPPSTSSSLRRTLAAGRGSLNRRRRVFKRCSVRRTASRQPAYLRSRVASSMRGSKRRSSRHARQSRRDRGRAGGAAGEIGGAQRGRLHHHRAVDRAAQDIGEELHGEVARASCRHRRAAPSPRPRPPASRRAWPRAGRGSGSRPTSSAARAISAAPALRVRPKMRAARLRVPIGRAEADKGRHQIDLLGRIGARGQRVDFRAPWR